MICTCSRSWIVLLSKLGRARDLSENEPYHSVSYPSHEALSERRREYYGDSTHWHYRGWADGCWHRRGVRAYRIRYPRARDQRRVPGQGARTHRGLHADSSESWQANPGRTG